MVVLAQLVRVPDCGSGGRGFEPRIPPKNKKASLYGEAFFVHLREVYPERVEGSPLLYPKADLSAFLFKSTYLTSRGAFQVLFKSTHF